MKQHSRKELEELYDQYTNFKRLGVGAFGSVIRAVSTSDPNFVVAIKKEKKVQMDSERLQDMKNELSVL